MIVVEIRRIYDCCRNKGKFKIEIWLLFRGSNLAQVLRSNTLLRLRRIFFGNAFCKAFIDLQFYNEFLMVDKLGETDRTFLLEVADVFEFLLEITFLAI